MFRRRFRGRGRNRPGRLAESLRDLKELGLRDLRPLERPEGTPEEIDLVAASRAGGAPVVIVASRRDGVDLLGWARVALTLDSGAREALIAAPAFSRATHAAARAAAEGGLRLSLVAAPRLAEDVQQSVLVERYPAETPGADTESVLSRVLRVVDGAAAAGGLGALSRVDSGSVLYARGVPVLSVSAEGDGIAVTFLAPDKRHVHVTDSNYARWGPELQQAVLELARDPRLLELAEPQADAAAERAARAARVRITARAIPWNASGSAPFEFAGIDAEGRPVLGVVRASVGLADAPAILAGLERLRAERQVWTPGAAGPPRLVLATGQLDGRARSVLEAAGVALETRALDQGAEPPAELREAREEGERRGRRRGRRRRGRRGDEPGAAQRDRERDRDEERAEPERASGTGPDSGAEDEAESPAAAERGAEAEESAPDAREEGGGRRRRRRRGRRGGERQRAAERELDELVLDGDSAEADDADEGEDEAADEEREAPAERRAGPAEEDAAEDAEPAAALAEEEEADEEEAVEPEPPPERLRPRQRRARAAICVRNDPDAILAALVLARDRRHITFFWVCQQSELMDFFRGRATDVGDDTDLLMVGFTAEPIPRQTIQTAELFRGRLQWFDAHEWAIEDVEALRDAIGEDSVLVLDKVSSPLAAVSEVTERRSRFTDKLVDFSARRLAEHEMEKWGYRLVGLIEKLMSGTGDYRSSISPVLAGKPADLPAPRAVYEDEERWLAEHDPRIIHFGEYQLVVVQVPAGLDAAEVGRRARLRTGARLSLATREGDVTVLLGANDEKRSLNLMGVADRVDQGVAWAHARPAGDRTSRLVVEELPGHPERIDSVIGEIVKHKSVLYG